MGRMSDIHIEMMNKVAEDGNDWDFLTDEQRKEYEIEMLTRAEMEYERQKEEEYLETVDRR